MSDQEKSKADLIAEVSFLRRRVAELEALELERKLVGNEIGRSQRLVSALSQAAQAVQCARTLEAVYRAIGEQAFKLGFYTTVLTLSDDQTRLAVSYISLKPGQVKTAEKLIGVSATGYSFPVEPGSFFYQLTRGGKTVFADLVTSSVAEALPPSARSFAEPLLRLLGWRQTIYAPLVIDMGRVQGILAFTGADLTEADVPAVTAFANQAAIALENARLYKEMQQLAAFNESIVQNMAEGIVVEDMDGNFTFVNPVAATSLGYVPDELVGKHWTDVIPPDQYTIVRKANERRQRGQSDRYELEAVCKDGSRISALLSGSPRFDAQGRYVGTMAVFTNITERKQVEEALREREDRLSKIIQAANDGMWDWDLMTNEVFFDPRYYGMAGYDVNEFPHHLEEFQNRVHPDDLADVMGKAQRYLDGKSPQFAVEFRFKKKDGSWLWVMGKGVIVSRDQAGNPLHFVGTHTDITSRRHAEEALRASEERFRKIFEEGPLGMAILTPDDHFISVNAALCRMVGYTEQELIGLTYLDITHPDDIVTSIQQADQLRQADIPYLQTEKRYLTKAGQTLWVNLTASYIRDDAGIPLYKLTMIEDITGRKQVEAERVRLVAQIHGQARHLEQILATVPEGVMLLDPWGRVLQANPVAERYLLILADAKVGDTLTHLGNCSLRALLTSPSTKGLWHEVQAQNRVFEVISSPMENGHEAEDWVMLINDVTQEREIRTQLQQQERLAAVGQLAAGIAHDFNNILATIVLYAQMVSRSQVLPERERERIGVISQQAWHATRLIQQILDFSRRAVLERRPLDFLVLLKEQVKLLERTLPEHIKIELVYGQDEYIVNADPTRMQQLLTNLAVNARDAMPEGGTLYIALERLEITSEQTPPLRQMEPGEWIKLVVADNGIGIAPDVLPHIYEPFFTTKEPGKGSGLGLAQVYGIVKQHRGHIDVMTAVGMGTTFVLYLPSPGIETSELPDIAIEDVPHGHSECILVVEDDAILRQALVDILELLNYRVLEADNGRMALSILENHADEVDLVLSDLVMPEMGGQALVHAMRQRGLTMPMVMLSGHLMMQETLENLQEHGVVGWLLKPPDVAEIARLLVRVLENSGD